MIRMCLEALLAERGWTQAELARRTGLRPATVHALYHNSAKGVEFATLDQLSRALGVPPGQLFKQVSSRSRKARSA